MIHNNSCPNTIYRSSLTSSHSSTSIKIKNNLKQLFILFRNKRTSISTSSRSSSSSTTKRTSSSTLAASSSISLSTIKNDLDYTLNNDNHNYNKSSSIIKKYKYRKMSNNNNNIIFEEKETDDLDDELKKKREVIPHVTVPPFSPTYCKPNEFPYSNYYIKLPNGNYIIRYRDGNRNILGSDEIQGYLI